MHLALTLPSPEATSSERATLAEEPLLGDLAHRRRALKRLWRLFSGKHFAKLDASRRQALSTLAACPGPHRHELPAASATAACLLWYHGTPAGARRGA